jgi:hypothetical protein
MLSCCSSGFQTLLYSIDVLGISSFFLRHTRQLFYQYIKHCVARIAMGFVKFKFYAFDGLRAVLCFVGSFENYLHLVALLVW